MRPRRRPAWSRVVAAGALASLAALALLDPSIASDGARPADGERSVLRVCAAADEAPYSTRDGRGFENRIARAVAEAMGREAVFVWSTEPAIYAVRDQLEMRACDMIVGIDSRDDRVLTSRPYYRAPYVFIQRRDTKLSITSWDSPDLLKAGNIGFALGTPAQTMLEKIGLFREHFNYTHSLTNYKVRGSEPLRVPPTRMVADVARGTADLAVGFAPEVARYVKANDELVMSVIPDTNVRADGVKIPHHFDQSLGVRRADTELLAALDLALEKAQLRIEEILREEGIPLLGAAPRS